MFLTVFYCFPLFMPKSEWLPSLFVPSDWSDLLLSLFTTGDHEQIVNSLITKERLCMSDSLFFHEHITISLFRSQKTSDSLIKPKSKFPTLHPDAFVIGFATNDVNVLFLNINGFSITSFQPVNKTHLTYTVYATLW